MAAKRPRTEPGGSFTGGTGDIKPQILTVNTDLGAVNQYTLTTIVLPTPRFAAPTNKSTVFEFLSVDFFPGLGTITDITQMSYCWLGTVTAGRSTGDTSTLASFEADLTNTRVFAAASVNSNIVTTGGRSIIMPIHVDLTDSNGNGMLIATDNITLAQGNVTGTGTFRSIAKIRYRLVNVGLTEYIGIVQSQQV